tara:strand:- start:10858 stop:12333 length:1476 start_codon:yes stop_codon:yes gene_type:complete
MSNQALPAILNVATIPTMDNMEIRTEVLDPITATNSQVVFQIPKTGILDGGSFVQLAVLTAGATDKAFLPLNTGIHSLIESCFLKVGSKVISSNTDYAHYTTAVRQMETPEHRAYVDMVKCGAVGNRWGGVEDGRIGYRDVNYDDIDGTAADIEATVPALVKPTNNASTTPIFMVPLSQLIPMMKARQLPLFAIKEHIYLEINFRQQTSAATDVGQIACFTQGNTDPTAIVPSLTNIKFNSDHLYYSDEQMENTSKQIFSAQGLSVLYEDIIVTNAQVEALAAAPPAGSVVSQNIERQIAVSGKVCRNILISDKPTNMTHKLLGAYFSLADRVNDEVNFRINDQRLFDRNLVSSSRKYEELAQVIGKPLYVPNQMYSLDADTNKAQVDNPFSQNSVYTGKIENHQLPNASSTNGLPDRTVDIRGTSHYVGVDLTTTGFNVLGNGKRVGVKPILLNKVYNRVQGRTGGRELRIFTSIESVMVIRQGEVLISA